MANVPILADTLDTSTADIRDADTLGGLYSASDITSIEQSLSVIEGKMVSVENSSGNLTKIYVMKDVAYASGLASLSISFPDGYFTEAPTIFGTVTFAGGYVATFNNVTATGCTLIVRLNNSVTSYATTVDILAIGK